MSIAISENFDNPLGQYVNYDAAIVEVDDLRARTHTDIRSFYHDTITRPIELVDLLADSMSDLNNLTMLNLESDKVIRPAEGWTSGLYGSNSSLGRRNALGLSGLAGDVLSTTSISTPVDLSTYDGADWVSVSLPSFPGDKINLSVSYVEFTQGSTTQRLYFTAANPVTGNQEVKWPVSALGTVLQPDTVKFSFTLTAVAVVTIAALRVLPSTWTPTKLDIDTRTERLVSIVDRDGSIPTTKFPRLWRQSDTDILPINSKMSCNFYSGHCDLDNYLKFYFRGRREDFLTQLDLDATLVRDSNGNPLYGNSQENLDSLKHQPDFGQAVYNPRPQTDFDTQSQTDLDTQSQAALERLPDSISESWIEVTLQWGSIARLTIATTETLSSSDQYIFDLAGVFTINQQYLLNLDLQDNSISVKLYEISSSGEIDYNAVFDTGTITDSFKLKRRKGRLGWDLGLADGDAWVGSISSRSQMFGEIISNNFESITPIEGSQLIVGSTPPQVVDRQVLGYQSATLAADLYNARSSDGSMKVTAPPGSGIQTSFFLIEDFFNSTIEFDFWYPSEAVGQNVFPVAFLEGDQGRIIPLTLSVSSGSRWQHYKIPLIPGGDEQAGNYKFVIAQINATQTWWIDNLKISRRAINWAGRASTGNAWNQDSTWVEFQDLINSEIDGVLFGQRTRILQIRGQSLVPEGKIDKFYINPKYAQLGRVR
jgi:hypothetical protein